MHRCIVVSSGISLYRVCHPLRGSQFQMFGAAVSPTGPGPGLFTATAKDSSKLSPLLKGGRVLSEKVHRLMGDYKLEGQPILHLDTVSQNLPKSSPQGVIPWL